MKISKPQSQVSLFSNDPVENLDLKNPFFTSQLITYIGNKRSLLPFLYKAFLKIRKKLRKKRLIVLDGFAGSGAVSRLLKPFSKELHVNDIENYAITLNKAFLANKSEVDFRKLHNYIDRLNSNKSKSKFQIKGFIETNYAPENDLQIKKGERVFYTNKNAKIIDNLRKQIKNVPEPYRTFCLASLLVEASIHNNTSGVFKGFHKKNGIGHFGGKGENALSRIKGEITLETPLLSDFESKVFIHKKDINELVADKKLPFFDLVYLDPPYNQHPYGSNYFMLNIINNDDKNPKIQKGVSGIAVDWNKSKYNKRREAEIAMDELLKKTKSHFIVISYNDEGIIPITNFKKLLTKHGKWELMEQDYNTYRGSRNLKNRSNTVKELLWILEKSKKSNV